MSRTVCLLAGVLLVVPSLGSDAPKEYDGTVAWDDELQGSWLLVGVDFNGKAVDFVESVQTFRNGKYTTKDKNGTTAGTYIIDASQTPAHLDEVPSEGPDTGRRRKTVYQLDGNTLKKAASPFWADQRPKSLDDKTSALVVIYTLKRVQK
jgi:uncharacterized protein (TIGR03067 family)